MKYFVNVKCIEDVKELYRELCKQYHPDLNRDIDTTKEMQQINLEYEEVFNRFKNIHKNINNEVYESSTESDETPETFREIINKIIFFTDCKIELIGRWIWVTGNTYPHRSTLNELKFIWCGHKKAWSWHLPEDSVLRHKSKISLEFIREKYGSTEIETKKPVMI
jgi:curved DNA-binding protein CbpA